MGAGLYRAASARSRGVFAADTLLGLLGSPPSFLPNDIEAVWELAEHRYVYIVVRPAHAGHAMHTVFVGDFDVRMSLAAASGIDCVEPA